MQAQSKIFQCFMCPRRYTRAFSLRNHVRTHTGERPFICTVCGKAFTRKNDCKTHELLHNGEKPYVCEGKLMDGETWGCGQRFARASNLLRHFKSNLGRLCLKPLMDEEIMKRNATAALIDTARTQGTSTTSDLTSSQQQEVDAEHSAAATLTEIARTGGQSLEVVTRNNGFDLAAGSSDLSKFPADPTTLPLALTTSIAAPDPRRDAILDKTGLNAKNVATLPSGAPAEMSLFHWPSTKRLLSSESNENYMMRREEDCSPIRIYGQGETETDHDTPPPKYPSACADRGPNEMNYIADGTSNFQSAASSSDADTGADAGADAEIDRSGLLKLNDKTARRYYQSYIDSMHKLHSFLDQRDLEEKVDSFIGRYCQNTSPRAIYSDLYPEKKRKRSHDDTHSIRDFFNSSSRPRVEPNIDNAFILLVFALGAICDCRSPLPSPISEENTSFEQQDIPSLLAPLTTPSSGTSAINHFVSFANPDSTLFTASSIYSTTRIYDQFLLPSPFESNLKDNHNRWAIPSTRDRFKHEKKLHYIPGSSLYGFATAILGNVQGGVRLDYVQAQFLAASTLLTKSWMDLSGRPRLPGASSTKEL